MHLIAAASNQDRTGTGNGSPEVAGAPHYLCDRREFAFFLWEHAKIDERFLGRIPFEGIDRAGVEALLDEAQLFAVKLAACYRDTERAYLDSNGTVVIPQTYLELWKEFREHWRWIRYIGERPLDAPRLGSVRAAPRMPPIVVQIISEMFMGANPAFMTYGSFTAFALRLIDRHGTERQKQLFTDRLLADEWDACYCATETQAGSDLTAIATSAEYLGDETYAIAGHKKYITAGMHSLTSNTLYMVLARIKNAAENSFSLSCFLVPRFWVDADGGLTFNHVECIGVEDKMGFNGCANAHLLFGRSGRTRGFLLGNRPNIALPQLVSLMRSARIGTGQFGLALASSAYLRSVRHARSRIQGRRFSEAADTAAMPVPIIEHPDVQRMLMEMRSKVEGCRGLIGKLVVHLTHIEQLKAAASPDHASLDRHTKLVLLYTPIVKAYVSDEAWRTVTNAIQVHGGLGYLRSAPLEQYARDIKVLSIWEGTNYMQAQDLLRDKLHYGRHSLLMRYFEEDIRQFLSSAAQRPDLQAEFQALDAALAELLQALGRVSDLAQRGEFGYVSQFCTRFLEMFAEVILGWVLLEAAVVASERLERLPAAHVDRVFYEGKIKCVRFFMHNSLPAVAAKGALLRCPEKTFLQANSEEFAAQPPAAGPTLFAPTIDTAPGAVAAGC